MRWSKPRVKRFEDMLALIGERHFTPQAALPVWG